MVTLQADRREDFANDDWEKALTAKDGHPLIALIAIIIVMALAASAQARANHAGESYAYLLGGAVGLTMMLWGVAYAITIRHASIAWKIATFIIVGLLSLFYVAGQMGSDNLAAKRDLAMLAEVRIADDGTTILPPHPDRGPASHVFLRYFIAMNDLKRDQMMMAQDFGLDRIADPQALTREPRLLRDCPRFARAKTESAALVGRMTARTRQLPGELKAAGIAPLVQQSLLDEMKRAMGPVHARMAASSAVIAEQFDEAQALCATLAPQRWQARGNVFVFSNDLDRRAYDRHVVRWNALIAQMQASLAATRARAAADQAKMREDLR